MFCYELTLISHWNPWLKIIFLSQYFLIVILRIKISSVYKPLGGGVLKEFVTTVSIGTKKRDDGVRGVININEIFWRHLCMTPKVKH